MSRSRLVTPLSLAVLAAGLFGAWMHWAVLDPRNVGWLLGGRDWGQNGLGLIAYLRARSPWPSLHDPLLMAPEGLSVSLTDSNPLLALLLRPFAGWLLPDGWQYAGLWLLACVGLQVVFAWRLVRLHAGDRGTALVATALLAGTPVLFARYGHLNLCAQWLILWALWLFVDPLRWRSGLRWAAVIGVAALVHPYLLVMVAAIWASALLRLGWGERAGMRAWLAVAVPGAAVLAGVPALLGLLTPVASTGTFGRFGMAADALWNPGREGYSSLLPAASTSPAQGFEGFNYLGAGPLALALVVVAARLRPGRADAPRGPSLRVLLWLVPAGVALALIASGGRLIWRGQVIASLPLPAHWTAVLDPLRASGRMVWPVYYAIVFAIVADACRLRHGRAVLLAGALLQVLDLTPALAVIRDQSARAAAREVFARTRDPRWAALVAGASAIEFHPGEAYRDLSLVEEVGWRAITACRPVPMRWFYASREPQRIAERLAADERRFRAGVLDPTRLYVLLRMRPPASVAGRVMVLDGVAVIPPARPIARPPGCVSPSSSSPRSAS